MPHPCLVFCPNSCAHERQLHTDRLPHPDPRAGPGPAGEEQDLFGDALLCGPRGRLQLQDTHPLRHLRHRVPGKGLADLPLEPAGQGLALVSLRDCLELPHGAEP